MNPLGLTFRRGAAGGIAPGAPSPADTGGFGAIADRILDIGSDSLNRRQDQEDLRLAARLNQTGDHVEQLPAFAARMNQSNGTIQQVTQAAPAPATMSTSTIILLAAAGIGAFALLR
jgi:hypothetical protein